MQQQIQYIDSWKILLLTEAENDVIYEVQAYAFVALSKDEKYVPYEEYGRTTENMTL